MRTLTLPKLTMPMRMLLLKTTLIADITQTTAMLMSLKTTLTMHTMAITMHTATLAMFTLLATMLTLTLKSWPTVLPRLPFLRLVF